VAPTRPTRPRLIVGGAAIVATAIVGALIAAEPGPLVDAVRLLVALAIGGSLVGVVGGFPAWGTVTAGTLGAAFVATLHERATVLDGRTPLVAAALLLVAELVTWAAEQRSAGRTVAGATVPPPVALLLCGLGAYLAGLFLTAAATLPVGRDLALTALGAAAVAVVTGIVVTMARGRTTG
jgi:hypothetical protein